MLSGGAMLSADDFVGACLVIYLVWYSFNGDDDAY